MKKITGILASLILIFSMAGMANANLTTIGTATYDPNGGDPSDALELSLIWDDDNNGQSVVWLDYSNSSYTTWADQMAWAASLDSALTIVLDGYDITFESAWRLPTSAGTNPSPEYDVITSEMGHLYYEEFMGVRHDDWVRPYNTNRGIFENLQFQNYWSSTGFSYLGDVPHFYFNYSIGMQSAHWSTSEIAGGLAIRSATVVVNSVPEPSTVLLFGSCLIGIVGIRKRLRKS